jgi:hypothetical protein
VALINRDPVDPLPSEYRSFVLHLIEGYGKLLREVKNSERRLRTMQNLQTKRDTDIKDMIASWHRREYRYRAEIRRLEKVAHKASSTDLQAAQSVSTRTLPGDDNPWPRSKTSSPPVSIRPRGIPVFEDAHQEFREDSETRRPPHQPPPNGAGGGKEARQSRGHGSHRSIREFAM